MKNKLIALFITFLLALKLKAKPADCADLYCVIANKSIQQHTISVYELQLVYLGKIKYWLNGSKIRVVILPINTMYQKDVLLYFLHIPKSIFKKAVKLHPDIYIKASNIVDALTKVSNTDGSIFIVKKGDNILLYANDITKLELDYE